MVTDPNAATLAAGGSEERPVVGNRYELLALLGAGGMGNVYKARDRELDELVALKVLRPELVATPGSIERFRREVKLARKVTHPNVARVFDIGEHGGDRILTMELVDGEALSTLIEREGPLPIARAIEIASTIATAVGAAHAVGVVHRDLKPQNVLVAKDGRVVVTDFGIARAVTGDASKTAGVVGTPAYMAPEQIEDGATVDARADIYALGAVLYELLTGQTAWTGDSVFSIVAARLLKPPPDPTEKRPDLPAPLGRLVLRCMARQMTDRPQSMAAVVSELATISVPLGSTPAIARAPLGEGLTDDGGVKRVAVLPFEEQGLGDQRYVADGLTEDLIDALSAARGLRVTSRGTVLRYQGGGRDARDVGRELNVAFVVEGLIRRAAAGFRIAVRLASVTDGFQLWSRRFDVTDTRLLAENDAIARAIAEALSVEIAPAAAVQEDAVSVDLYLRARDAAQRAFSGSMVDAFGLFEQALARSPDEPRLLAGYALAMGQHPFLSPEARQRALDAADRAVTLAPLLPDGYVAGATFRMFQLGDGASAVRPLRRALRLAPHHAGAHATLGEILGRARHEGALAHLERAFSLEPETETTRLHLYGYHTMLGNWDAAMSCLEGATVGLRLPALARGVFWRRDVAGAREVRDRLSLDLPADSPHRRIVEATVGAVLTGTPIYDFGGELGDPRFLAFEIVMFLGEMEADMAAFAGDRDRCISALVRLEQQGSAHLAWFEGSPLLDVVREHPTFQRIRSEIAARAARAIAEYETPLLST